MTAEEILKKNGVSVNALKTITSFGGTTQLDKIIKAMHEYAAQANQWVPVSERLPEIDERVFLTIVSLGERYTCIGKIKKDGLYYKDKGTISKPMEIVTHWQPLPTPQAQ